MTCFDFAQRFVGIRELAGGRDHPLIQYCFMLCGFSGDTHDEVPWCSAFVQLPPFLLGLPRSRSARARHNLLVGLPIELNLAEAKNDMVILMRGQGQQPGPENTEAQGHVGWYAGMHAGNVLVLGGNQSSGVTIEAFDHTRILGIRRLS